MDDQRWGELEGMIDALLEGMLSEEEADRLAVWLSIDEEAQAVYLEMMEVHAELTLTYCEQQPAPAYQTAAQHTPHGSYFSDEFGGVLASALSTPVESDCASVREETRELVQIGRRLATLCRYAIFASLALIVAVVAAFGSERLISGVLSARRSSLADPASGMLSFYLDENKDVMYQGANPLTGTRRVGSSRTEGVALANIFLFPLPALHELERIESARIEWTCKTKDDDPQFSVDLYGLGFISPQSQTKLHFWEGALDLSLRSDYDMAGSPSRRVALLKRGVMTPQTPCGQIAVHNACLVRFLQSLYEDGAREGDFAVFRLNADVSTMQIPRETGYAVVHPPVCTGVTTAEELPALIITAASRRLNNEQVTAKAVMAAHSISEHWSGGLVRSFKNRVEFGCNADGTRRIGSSAAENAGLANVLVFSLPAVHKFNSIVSARLEWTCATRDGDPDFSVDLYGLGYMRGDSYPGPCFWEGRLDTSSPVDYALQGHPDRHVARIAPGVMTPDTSCGRLVVENSALIEFLQSLYENGARDGDLVVFRLNADVSTLDIARSTGYSIVHAPDIPGQTRPSELPALLITFD